MDDREKLRELETKLAELRGRLPKHSVSAAMMIELEELEEEIEALRVRASNEQN